MTRRPHNDRVAGDKPAALRTHVLDTEGLVRLFQHLAGCTLLGAVDGGGCVELVFTDPARGNLVTIFTADAHRGVVAHGFVSQEQLDAGYGQP